MTKRPAHVAGLPLTSDGAIGAAGCCLAVAALSFGIYMNVHGPSENLGKSHEFSVFAQLAPRAAPASKADDLDMTATATIPAGAPPQDGLAGTRDPAPSAIIVEAADRDSATIAIGGRIRQVRIGDDVPGAGAVSAIVPGPRPLVRTTRGITLSSRER